MTPGQAFVLYFALFFVVGEILVWLATRRDREGMSGAHPWIAVAAALFAGAFAF